VQRSSSLPTELKIVGSISPVCKVFRMYNAVLSNLICYCVHLSETNAEIYFFKALSANYDRNWITKSAPVVRHGVGEDLAVGVEGAASDRLLHGLRSLQLRPGVLEWGSKISIGSRVTRLGEFSPIGGLFIVASSLITYDKFLAYFFLHTVFVIFSL
jgi:hypothetical protein